MPDTPEVPTVTYDLIQEMMRTVKNMEAKMDAVVAENTILKEQVKAQTAEADLRALAPAADNSYSYLGSRAAVSVVLPTRPVMEDPGNPAWKGRVAGTGGRGKE